MTLLVAHRRANAVYYYFVSSVVIGVRPHGLVTGLFFDIFFTCRHPAGWPHRDENIAYHYVYAPDDGTNAFRFVHTKLYFIRRMTFNLHKAWHWDNRHKNVNTSITSHTIKKYTF